MATVSWNGKGETVTATLPKGLKKNSESVAELNNKIPV